MRVLGYAVGKPKVAISRTRMDLFTFYVMFISLFVNKSLTSHIFRVIFTDTFKV